MPLPSVPLDALPQPAVLFDAGGRIVAANAAAEALAGRPLAGLAGDELVRAFGHRRPDGTPLAPGDLPSALAKAGGNGGTVEVPLVITAADGRALELVASASPIVEAGAVTGVLVVWRDITGQRRTEAALAASEERFRAAFEQSPMGMGLGDPDGRVLASNAVLEEMLGYGRDELRGISFVELTHPDHLAREVELLRGVLAGKADRYEIEKRYVRRDGRTIWVRLVAALIRDAGGVARGWIAVHEDVTERKRMEAALAASNAELERQRRLLDGILGAMPHLVSLWGRDQRLVWANERLAAALGRPRGDLVGRTWRELAQEAPWVASLADAAMPSVAAGTPFTCEVETAGPGWAAVTFLPIFGDSLLVIIEEITARKRAEAGLRESEERLRLAQESADVGLWDWDVATGRQTFSPELLRLYGVPPETLRTYDSWRRQVHPDDIERVEAEQEAALAAGEPLDLEYRILLPSGGYRWIASKGRGVTDDRGQVVRVLGVNIDITARKVAELELARYAEDLRESRQQLADVIEATGVGYYRMPLRGSGGTISRRGAEILGLLSEGPCPLPAFGAWVRERVHPDDLDGLLDSLAAAIAGETERSEVEFRMLTRDGRYRWVQAITTTVDRGEDGRAATLAGFLFDIDGRKQAEVGLQRSNEELQRFAYVASHDLQEPLRSIVSFSQLLERRYRGRLDSDADDYISFIVEGGNRMQTLIRDLLQVSRVETGAKPLEPTDAAEVVAGALRVLEAPLREAGAAIAVGQMPRVLADAAQLEQVFVNLIGNAIKYRRPDVPLEVRVSADRPNGWWAFAVADNGIGIEAEYFDRIFEMFSRLHTHDKYEGTGIGLAVVKKIVERHGGKVWVESTPGEGSTFFFTLPAA